MACTRKVRRSPNDPSDSNTSPTRRNRLRRSLRRAVVRTIAVSALTALIRRAIERRRAATAAADAALVSTRASSTPASGVAEWAPLAAPGAESTSDGPAWVEPADGQCPLSHPVKGNASSNIYHVPGSRFYDMTTPERCYLDAAAAEADGMRAPKR